MCGIFAAIGPHECKWASTAVEILAHRGPDAHGVASANVGWAQTTLGMSRLKIVDQSCLTVPFSFPYLNVLLAYNGEVYNKQKLRSELSNGMPWETSCDAELVARAWRRWHGDALHHLNGMFGFVLVDIAKREVIIARDRAGKKPVYYVQRRGMLYVSSELKALPTVMLEMPCKDVDLLEFDFRNRLPLASISVLEPGSFIELTAAEDLNDPIQRTWWALPESEEIEPTALPVAVDKVQELLTDAIKIRAEAQVPVALPLSGGLDSAIIQAVIKSERLYCVTFNEIDNLAAAKLASQGKEVTPVQFDVTQAMEAMGQVAYHLDTPATWSALCLWFMAKRMRMDGVKVMLSGEGADELFGGYSRYRILHWLDQMAEDPHLEAYGSTIRRVLGGQESLLHKMLDRGGLAEEMSLEILQGGPSLVDRMSRTDFMTTMQVLLRMSDRMMMAHGIEGRMPYLDHRLVELAYRLPASLKVTSKESKPILREIGRRLGVPREITEEKSKKGLAIPWRQWRSTMVYSQSEGARGEWDRTAFAKSMKEAWRRAICRPALCRGCEES